MDFSGDWRDASGGGYGGPYIGGTRVLWGHESMATSNLSGRYVPTLSNGVDGLSKAVGNRRRKEFLTGGPHRPAGL
jgi:hypothetical protein